MQETFFITVNFRGQTTQLEGLIIFWDHMHKIVFNIDGICVVFNPGKNQKYVVKDGQSITGWINPELLYRLARRLNSWI